MSEKKELETVDDLKMVQRYLKYGLEFHELAACHLVEANLKFEATIKQVDTEQLTLELEITAESYSKIKSEIGSASSKPQSEIRLNYSVDSSTIFLSGILQNLSAGRLSVQVKTPLQKLQRRESLRMKIQESHDATISLGGTSFPIYDISAGGVSILVGLLAEKDFEKQKLFPASILSFLGKDIKVDLEVKSCLVHGRSGQKLKVGLAFKALPQNIEQMIVREVYQQTQKIWSRWI